MQTRQLGNTDLTVSEIGMGTWELGGQEWGEIAEKDALDLLRYAFDSGITLYDTADQYGGGRSESLLGQAFAEMKDSQVQPRPPGGEQCCPRHDDAGAGGRWGSGL